MNKVKLKERLENAVEAFFDNEKLEENNSLVYLPNGELLQDKSEEDLFSKPNTISKILKQVFLFLPGTFLLFYISLGTIFMLSEVFFNPNINFTQNEILKIFSILIGIYSLSFFAIFMTWFGIGNIKNRKDSVIPISIIILGIVVGLITQFMTTFIGLAEKIKNDFSYAIWLFPLALITPILVKGWLDKEESNEQS